MAVTADEYELPLIVEETPSALANKLEVSSGTITKLAWKNSSRQSNNNDPRTKYRIVKVKKI